MLVQLKMVKRQDLINFLQRIAKPATDQIVSEAAVWFLVLTMVFFSVKIYFYEQCTPIIILGHMY